MNEEKKDNKNKENQIPKKKEPKDEFEPEYYEPISQVTQNVTNIIGWIIALILLASGYFCGFLSQT